MAIPDFQSIMLPLLNALKDGQEHSNADLIVRLSSEFGLTDEEKRQLLPSGTQPIFNNRFGWAKTYMLKAGLLQFPRRGYTKITQRGHDILTKKIDKIDIGFLEQYPEFIEFRAIKKEQVLDKGGAPEEDEGKTERRTPDELIETGFNSIQANLGQELLERLRKGSPSFFEKVVLKLLENMGYGKGQVTGRSGDGGIDGFISQDRLGLDKILFQAKRFDEGNPISASMLRDFLGALESRGVSKGVFITTSRFPINADDVLAKIHKSVVLIGGPELVNLMIDFNIAVSTEKTYEIKRIDSDFFEEE